MAEKKRVALALMAHPDDAEILCGGTLIRLADAGWQVHIASLTAGDCGTMTETPWAIAARRTDEAQHAAAVLGAEYYFLGELDGLVVYDRPTIRKCTDLMRKITPSLVFTHAPKDYMVDHEMASLLARAATFLHGIPNASGLPLQPGTHVPYLYYCDPLEGLDPFGKIVEPTSLVDIGGVLERKAEMLGCHISQREWLRSYHGTDEYLDSMRRFANERGRLLGVSAAEAFIQHRGHAYPSDDLLMQLFPPTTIV